MTPVTETIMYPFLFLALYFEVFAVLTFFDRDARRRRMQKPSENYDSVAIIVPCFNEEKTVGKAAESLLALDYPADKLTVVLVDDGSTDDTARVMDSYASNPRVRIIHKENGGKHTALNAGIALTTTDFIGCLDADSFAAPDALKEVMSHFDDERIGAVTASMSVHAPKSILQRMQAAEYLLGIALRHILATWNGLYVTPGPLSVFRRKVFQELGPFTPAHNTEDMEIAMRMQRAGWKIQNAPRAQVFTNAPRTLGAIVKQRTRWTTGFIKNGFDYRDLFGNPRYGVLGLLVLPLGIFSILSGIVLFFIVLLEGLRSIVNTVTRILEVPFTFTLPTFDWFFAPVSALAILAVIAIVISVALMLTGASISRTKTSLGPSVLWYLALYAFVAPLWLIRSVSDVTLGITRSWR